MQARAIVKARRAGTPGDLGCLAGAHGLYEAGELSVSIATVDRVLSGRTVVRESTAARVLAAAQALASRRNLGSEIGVAFEQAQRLGATELAAKIRTLSQQLSGLEADLERISGTERRLVRMIKKTF
jgi:seryl-tRNA synthetase